MSRAIRTNALALVLLTTALAAAFSLAGASNARRGTSSPEVHVIGTAASITNRAALGERLVNRFYGDLQHHDLAGLRRLLSPTFNCQSDRLASCAALDHKDTILSYKIRRLSVSANTGVLVAMYQVKVNALADGKRLHLGYQPRISVFTNAGNGWHLMRHASFKYPFRAVANAFTSNTPA